MSPEAPRRKQRNRKQDKALESHRKDIGGPLLLFVLGGLLLGGVYTRVVFLDRSLWLDEAWVANSILSPSLHEAIYYDDWLQTTPPLFVAVSRLITMVFGTSNIALRAFPAVAGIAAIVLFAFVALRQLKPSYAMVATLLFVFSPRLILYSQSLKQYSTDVLSMLVLIAAAIIYIEKRTDRRFYLLAANFMVLSFISYPVMIMFPFLLYAAFDTSDAPPGAGVARNTLRRIWPRLTWAMAAGVFVSAINYWFFIEPNKSFALVDFFNDGFYQGRDMTEFLAFYGTRLLTVPGMFFFGAGGPLPLVAGLIIVAGFISLWLPQRVLKGAASFETALVLTLPLVGSIAFNLIGVFPLPGFDHRLLLFVFPSMVLVFGLGLQFLVSLACSMVAFRDDGTKAARAESALGAAVFVGMVVLVLLFFGSVGLEPYFAEEQEDNEQAVAYLTQQVQANDILYVHASMREQFKLYNRATPVRPSSIVYGRIGMPCCPRKDYRSPSQESVKDIAEELFALGKSSIGRSLWVLITDRPLHWVHTERNDIRFFESGLASQSCAKVNEARFTGIYLARFECKPG